MSIFDVPIPDICTKIRQIVGGGSCTLCDAPSGDAAFCAPCHAELPWHRAPQCPICAWPTPQGEVCGVCARKPPYYRHLRAALVYGFPVDRLIHNFKYRGQLHLGRVLAGLLAESVQTETMPDLILPVPLHPQRLRERGYNQAAELARLLGRQLHCPVALDAAERTRHTPQQTALDRDQRSKNMRDAFAVRPTVYGQRLALVDDVVTTGATVDALAQAALRAGAVEVMVWCVGRAIPGPAVMG